MAYGFFQIPTTAAVSHEPEVDLNHCSINAVMICVHIYTHIYIYIYVYVKYVYTCANAFQYTHTYTCMRTCMYIYIQICIYAYTHIYARVRFGVHPGFTEALCLPSLPRVVAPGLPVRVYKLLDCR